MGFFSGIFKRSRPAKVKPSKRFHSAMVIKDGRRMYDAGTVDRLTKSWDSSPWTIDQVIYSQLETLRSRSREQYRNNDYVSRFAQVLQNNVTGHTGFKLRSKVLDYKGSADRAARAAIERAWAAFSDECDLVGMCHVIEAQLVTDGEAFVHLGVGTGGKPKPKLIDPALIDLEHNRNEQGRPLIVFGIEYDDSGDPVAYWVNDDYSKYHPGVGNTGQGSAARRTRIPASQILHIFRKFAPGQRRGIPWIASSLGRLFQLGRYEEAALTAARIGASKMGFFKSPEGDQYTGDGESGEMNMNAEAGTFENIGEMEFQAFDPTYPAGEFKDFITRSLRGISSGLGVDYHTLGNDLEGVNYSSARVGMLETREHYKSIQNWMISSLIRPLFSWWLEIELFAGRIMVAGRALNRGFDYYAPAEFYGRRWEWVDPLKEIQAVKEAYSLRLTSLSKVARERGEDLDDILVEIAEENKRMKELGVEPQQVLDSIQSGVQGAK